jgi:hypothetical protein
LRAMIWAVDSLLTASFVGHDPEQTLRSAFTLPNEPSEVGLAWRDDARRPGGFDEGSSPSIR